MKSAGIVILLPLVSVLIVSLYVAGGASRAAALILLGASVVGAVAGFLWRRNARHDA
jgi:positive regulator of sigma E activity